jgi:hypothetical protein
VPVWSKACVGVEESLCLCGVKPVSVWRGLCQCGFKPVSVWSKACVSVE